MKKIVTSKNAPAPIGPYNQATVFNQVMYISGQIAINTKTGELVMDNIEDETKQVMDNLGAILSAAGIGYDHILKCSIFVKDIGQYDAINTVYGQYFDEDTAPARELVQVVKLPKDVNIEISAIAGIS